MSERPLVSSTKVELVRAHLGTVSLTGIGGNPVKVGLKRAVLHPQYNPSILDFDVAVLELARPLDFNKYIQPICLPLAIQKFPVGRKCMISGWGNTQEGNGEFPAGSLLPTPADHAPLHSSMGRKLWPAGPMRLRFINKIWLAHSHTHPFYRWLGWLSCYQSSPDRDWLVKLKILCGPF